MSGSITGIPSTLGSLSSGLQSGGLSGLGDSIGGTLKNRMEQSPFVQAMNSVTGAFPAQPINPMNNVVQNTDTTVPSLQSQTANIGDTKMLPYDATKTPMGVDTARGPVYDKPPVDMDAYQRAISHIESGSPEGNYNILGKTTKSGDRAIGRYQVMGNNVPSWTEKWYGKKLTPEQFRNSPEAQDAVFKGEFGSYVDQYGPSAAAAKWFTGSPYTSGKKDITGTSDNQYVQMFNKYVGDKATTSPTPTDTSKRPVQLDAMGKPVPQINWDNVGKTTVPTTQTKSPIERVMEAFAGSKAKAPNIDVSSGTASGPGGMDYGQQDVAQLNNKFTQERQQPTRAQQRKQALQQRLRYQA